MFTYGYVLKTTREYLKISQKELANRIGCSQSLVSRIEQEKTSPTLHFIDRCSDVVGLSESFMLLLRYEDKIEKLQKKIKIELDW